MAGGGRSGTDELDPMVAIEREVDEATSSVRPYGPVVHEGGMLNYLESDPSAPPATEGDDPFDAGGGTVTGS